MKEEALFKKIDWLLLFVGGAFLGVGVDLCVTGPINMGVLFLLVGGAIIYQAKDAKLSINRASRELTLEDVRIITRKKYFRVVKYDEVEKMVLRELYTRHGEIQNELIMFLKDKTKFKMWLGNNQSQSLVGQIAHQPKPPNPFVNQTRELAEEIGVRFEETTN